MTNYNNSSNW